jgi:hemerythrin-like domain-containing protein
MGSCHLHLDRPAAATLCPATADLRHEHEVILQALVVLERAANLLAAGQPLSESTLADLVQFLRTFADRCHHGKEEEQLFPAMRAKGAGSMLTVFIEEHEEGRGYLRTLASGAPLAERVAAARRYVGMLRDHIERENEVLFPLADGLFNAEELGVLVRAYEDVERHVVGSGGHDGLVTTLGRLDAAVPSAPGRS